MDWKNFSPQVPSSLLNPAMYNLEGPLSIIGTRYYFLFGNTAHLLLLDDWKRTCAVFTLAPEAQILTPSKMASSEQIPNLGSFLETHLNKPLKPNYRELYKNPTLGCHGCHNPVLGNSELGHTSF